MTGARDQLITASEDALKVLVRLCRDRDEDFGTTLSDMRKAIERAKVTELSGEDDIITRYQDLLSRIRDYAHDASTGPAVPDALWEIRSMIDDEIYHL